VLQRLVKACAFERIGNLIADGRERTTLFFRKNSRRLAADEIEETRWSAIDRQGNADMRSAAIGTSGRGQALAVWNVNSRVQLAGRQHALAGATGTMCIDAIRFERLLIPANHLKVLAGAHVEPGRTHAGNLHRAIDRETCDLGFGTAAVEPAR